MFNQETKLSERIMTKYGELVDFMMLAGIIGTICYFCGGIGYLIYKSTSQ